MTKEQFIQQMMIHAERAWELMQASKVSDDAARILAVLEAGPINAVGGDRPVRARDVLRQKLRKRDGRGIGAARLNKALRELDAEGWIEFSADHRRLELSPTAKPQSNPRP